MDTPEFEMTPPAGVSPASPMNAATERRLKWNELALRIEHYKYYLTRALHVTIFFYAITGGVLGFYLKGPAVFPVLQPPANAPFSSNAPSPTNTSSEMDRQTEREVQYRQQMELFLLLPILMGSVLGGVFLYGARLQEDAVDTMEHLREDLRERFGLDVGELYDAQLLNILLRIFGYIYFSVAILLGSLPIILNHARPSGIFIVLAVGVFATGLGLPLIAKWLSHILKVRRRRRMLKRIESWGKQPPDFSDGVDTDFYYVLRYYLGAEITGSLNKETTESFDKKTKIFQKKWTDREPKSYFRRRTYMIPNTHIQAPKEQYELKSPPSQSNSATPEHKDFLCKIYEQCRSDLRHLRTERSTASNMVLVTAIGVIGFVARKPLAYEDWPLTCGLIVIGVFGTIFTANHFQCIQRCKNRADYYLACLNTALGLDKTSETETSAEGKTITECPPDWRDDEWPRLREISFRGKVRVLWPLAIALIGFIASLYIFIRLSPKT